MCVWIRDAHCMGFGQINNYISLQQARLAHEQAEIATRAAVIQQKDSQSNMRLSVVATVFLPLSFATVRTRQTALPFRQKI